MRAGRLFIWLSGADKDILSRCTHIPRSERVRFGGLGALVFVPAGIGLISMTYAVSTVASDPRVFVPAGMTWGLIVLAIDRYLVSTLHRSTVRSSGARGLSILTRYVFAIFIGIAVAHPLTLLWFNESIGQQLAENRRSAIAARLDDAQAKVADLPHLPQSDEIRQARKALAERTDYLDCLRELQTAEQSGRAVRLECGFSSGEITCGPRCLAIGQQIEGVEREVDTLSDQLAEVTNDNAAQLADAQADREAARRRINKRADADIRDIRAEFSADYLARVAALAQLANAHPHVTYVAWFLILFFVLVDVLPITVKLATPGGEYELIRDTLLIEREMREAAQREVAGIMPYRSVAEARANFAARREEIEELLGTFEYLTRMYEQRMLAFEHRARSITGKLRGDVSLRGQFLREIAIMRNGLHDAWKAGWERFITFVTRGSG